MKNGMIECSVCRSKIMSPTTKSVSRAYDRHRSKVSSKQRVLNVLLVVGDCFLVGLQVCEYMFQLTFKLSDFLFLFILHVSSLKYLNMVQFWNLQFVIKKGMEKSWKMDDESSWHVDLIIRVDCCNKFAMPYSLVQFWNLQFGIEKAGDLITTLLQD